MRFNLVDETSTHELAALRHRFVGVIYKRLLQRDALSQSGGGGSILPLTASCSIRSTITKALSSSPDIGDFRLAVRTLRVLTTSRDAGGVSNDSESREFSRPGLRRGSSPIHCCQFRNNRPDRRRQFTLDPGSHGPRRRARGPTVDRSVRGSSGRTSHAPRARCTPCRRAPTDQHYR